MSTDKTLKSLWNFQKMEESAKVHSYQIFERLNPNLLQVINQKAQESNRIINVSFNMDTTTGGGRSFSPLSMANHNQVPRLSANGKMFEKVMTPGNEESPIKIQPGRHLNYNILIQTPLPD